MTGDGAKFVIYATDKSSMQNWKFTDEDTHILLTEEDMRERLLEGGFASDKMGIRTVKVMPEVRGRLAAAWK